MATYVFLTQHLSSSLNQLTPNSILDVSRRHLNSFFLLFFQKLHGTQVLFLKKFRFWEILKPNSAWMGALSPQLYIFLKKISNLHIPMYKNYLKITLCTLSKNHPITMCKFYQNNPY